MFYRNETLAGRSAGFVRLAQSARADAVSGVFSRTRRGLGGALRAVGRGIRRVAASWGRSRQRRTAIRQLRAMPDYLLKDIGIDRGQIPAVVDGEQPGARHSPPTGDRRVLHCADASALLLHRRAAVACARC